MNGLNQRVDPPAVLSYNPRRMQFSHLPLVRLCLVVVAFLATGTSAAAVYPSTRAATCATFLTESLYREQSTTLAIKDFRELHSRLGHRGLRNNGRAPVALAHGDRNPITVRRARGRLETIRKDFSSGHLWAEENGVTVRGVEIVGRDSIEYFLRLLQTTRECMNQQQVFKDLAVHASLLLQSIYWADVAILTLSPPGDPTVKMLMPWSSFIPFCLYGPFNVYDGVKLFWKFDRTFDANIVELQTRLDSGTEKDWYYFGDTVRLSGDVVNGEVVNFQALDRHDATDLTAAFFQWTARLGSWAAKSEAPRTFLLSIDVVLWPGPTPRLALLIRTYPKPPTYPVQVRRQMFAPLPVRVPATPGAQP